MLIIDQLAYSNQMTKSNPFYKMGFGVVSLLACISFSWWMLHISLMCLMICTIIFKAKIPAKVFLRIFAWPFSFLLLSFISIIFSVSASGASIAPVFWKSISVYNVQLGITHSGLNRGVRLIIRSAASISCLLFISLTTPFDQQIKILKCIYIPDMMIELFALTYRFIAIFLEEASTMYTAQQMRFGYVGYRRSINSVAMIIKLLFHNVLRRYREMEIALDAKLYRGKFYIS